MEFLLKTLALSSLAILTATSLSAETLTVYSSREPELIDPVIELYEEKTGNDVEVAFIKDGLLERLVAEGTRSKADVILTVDVGNIIAIKEAGATQAITSDALTSAIPELFRDEENEWFGLTTRARILYASKERVDAGDIAHYEELADPKWQGRICSRSGLHDYNIALTAAFYTHHGEAATKEWLEAVKSNLAHSPDGNDRAQAKAIAAGECDIALGNTYYLGKMENNPEQKPWVDAISPIFLTFEDGGTHMNISAGAVTKASVSSELATEFLAFLASDEAQSLYAEINHEYPINPNVPASTLVQSWGEITPDNIKLTDYANARPIAVSLVQEVDFDK